MGPTEGSHPTLRDAARALRDAVAGGPAASRDAAIRSLGAATLIRWHLESRGWARIPTRLRIALNTCQREAAPIEAAVRAGQPLVASADFGEWALQAASLLEVAAAFCDRLDEVNRGHGLTA